MKKILVLLFMLLSGICLSQVPEFRPNQFRLLDNSSDASILVYRPVKQIKITFKTMINDNVVDNIFEDLSEGIDLGEADYLGIGKYDIRLKYYMNSRLRLLGRLVVRRLDMGDASYYIGFEYKF